MAGRFGLDKRCCPGCVFWCTIATFLLLMVGLIVCFMHEISEMLHYSIAVDSAAGLDDLGRPTVDPEFELTLGVASRSFLGRQCVDSGLRVEVSYRGVLLAASGPAKELCAGARRHREQSVVAFGVGVHLPGSVRDSLAADMRRGAQSYDVALRLPSHAAYYTLASCGARQVGGDASLTTPCDESA